MKLMKPAKVLRTYWSQIWELLSGPPGPKGWGPLYPRTGLGQGSSLTSCRSHVVSWHGQVSALASLACSWHSESAEWFLRFSPDRMSCFNFFTHTSLQWTADKKAFFSKYVGFSDSCASALCDPTASSHPFHVLENVHALRFFKCFRKELSDLSFSFSLYMKGLSYNFSHVLHFVPLKSCFVCLFSFSKTWATRPEYASRWCSAAPQHLLHHQTVCLMAVNISWKRDSSR